MAASVPGQLRVDANRLYGQIEQLNAQLSGLDSESIAEKAGEIFEHSKSFEAIQTRLTACGQMSDTEVSFDDVIELSNLAEKINDLLNATSQRITTAQMSLIGRVSSPTLPQEVEGLDGLQEVFERIAFADPLDGSALNSLKGRVELLGGRRDISEHEQMQASLLLMQIEDLMDTIAAPSSPVREPSGSSSRITEGEQAYIDYMREEQTTMKTTTASGTATNKFNLALAFLEQVVACGEHVSSSEGRNLLAGMVRETKDLLSRIVIDQRSAETPSVDRTVRTPLGILTTPLAQLHQALANNDTRTMDVAYKQLSAIEKQTIFRKLIVEKVPMGAGADKLNAGLHTGKTDFSKMPGTIEQKRNAVLNSFPEGERPNTATPTPSISQGPSVASTLEPRLNSALRLELAAAARSEPTRVASPEVIEDRSIPMSLLNQFIKLANASGDLESLMFGYTEIADIEGSFGVDYNGSTVHVQHRPYFHMQKLHENESPAKLTPSLQHGADAFFDENVSTADERKRALQRTAVEVALANLEGAIAQNNPEIVTQTLAALETLQLDEKDRPGRNAKITERLYWLIYKNYRDAQRAGTSTINPNDSRYGGNFGPAAFAFDNTVQEFNERKIAAIAGLKAEMKADWKI